MPDSAQPGKSPESVRRKVRVRGVVQGVGFRPFIYRIATEEHLAGFIGNDTNGVAIEIEGSQLSVESFIKRLTTEAPPLSRIDSVAIEEIAIRGESTFRIVASEVLGQVSTGIPADAATCADCLRELLDPADRRYRYPFLNCTNCGPRFTITRRIPYDRPQTSMAGFKMCPACQAEYDDPANRRFHAQPNACWDCGPQLSLVSSDGKLIAGGGQGNSYSDEQGVSGHEFSRATSPAEFDLVEGIIDRLTAGEMLAIKGIGGFHLGVDATNDQAVLRLRERKHRYGKPLAVMVRDLDAARRLCEITTEEEALLTTPARPIVLLRARAENGIAPSVAPGIPWLGLFLPYAPLHHLLFADGRLMALVMTSANLSEEPIAIDNDEARARLAGIADAFVLHDREILQRCDDSVVSIVDSAPQIIRRARGFVPLGIPLPFDAPPLLAVGGHLKSVFTLARGRFAYQSQHLGDLENITGLDFFRESLAHLMHTFEIEPEAVVHDLHPGYLSTRWAKDWAAERNVPLIAVQHHHAHIAACIAEHALQGPVIGLSLDGTGYGTDGNIWGGEVLICSLDRDTSGFRAAHPSVSSANGRELPFTRFAHLNYVAMPGGDAAVREPWRMAFAHLLAAGISQDEAQQLTGASDQEARLLARMIDRKLNAPLTSSLGRLFDAVAALVLNRRTVDYEAQAAIELEGVAVDKPLDFREPMNRTEYVLQLSQTGILKTDSLWRALIGDLRSGVPKQQIAAQFHVAVASAFIHAAEIARENTDIARVVLSGGCMHNRRLARLLRSGLEAKGFEVFQHHQVSPGDGGLSYGQAALAAAVLGNWQSTDARDRAGGK